tara:strand:- start:3242 stop:4615 length:1374 start_codon:yes stop_codon:yes gene_type:complete
MKIMKSIYECQECGARVPKPQGRCFQCGTFDSIIEVKSSSAENVSTGRRDGLSSLSKTVQLYDDVDGLDSERLTTGSKEFDRVLGGGIVRGSLVLIGGEPGIGKSTLLLQVAAFMAANLGPILYVSGEESDYQIKMRGKRLGLSGMPLHLLSETCTERILQQVQQVKPVLLVVDSVQTMYSSTLESPPGSIGQVRETTNQLLVKAKNEDLPILLVGHVTKEGGLAGPKALEHVVDTVLYFEGDRFHTYRIIRAAKNRFGAVSELGVFEMTGSGLQGVSNPSKLFLSDREKSVPGSVVICSLEGSRPLLIELQALVNTGSYGNARRTSSGLDRNRLSLLLAVLDTKVGINLSSEDVYLNVAGGLTVDEPAADLGVVAALTSSLRKKAIDSETFVFGEISLAGEIRGASQAGLRLKEAAQLGFKRCVMPKSNVVDSKLDGDIEQIGVTTIEEALEVLFT